MSAFPVPDAPTQDAQSTMALAVLGDPAAFAETVAILRPGRINPARRLYIHVATVTEALLGVLGSTCPAVADLLGPARFRELAVPFLRAHPPTRPDLSAYGPGFAEHLADAGEVAAAALARLDLAAHRAYGAADAPAMVPADLAALPPEALASLTLRPVPSAAILPTDATTRAAWTARRGDLHHAAAPSPDGTTAALIWRRPDLTVTSMPLAPGPAALLTALAEGRPLLDAANALLEADPEGEPIPVLLHLLGHGVLAASTDQAPEPQGRHT